VGWQEGEFIMSKREQYDHPELNQPNQTIWDENATWWDEQIGEGNVFQNRLIGPATERLLNVRPGQAILDLACGNGVFSRRLAALGAHVTACDFSPTFLERAKARSAAVADRIEYRLADLTDKEQLRALGAGGYDAAVCNMALMDMASISPLLQALRTLLKPTGSFVFSVLHPCFNTTACTMLAEQVDEDGVLRTYPSVRVRRYLGLGPTKGVGIAGQPQPHFYFNRPLSVLLSACFGAGFVMDGLEEPAFGPVDSPRPLAWESLPDIPPVLVVRMRLMPIS
jgi:2-polyprenyl-3-methyl-5-hydroxy-6-metoxy-1,4-benzoquinol methylase